MPDNLKPEQRSFCMSRIKGKDTGIELKLRSSLHKKGFRFRLHDNRLPGSPDLVFPKYKAVIFVHGCFWHRHGCKKTTTPTTREDFWKAKFKANVERDARNVKELETNGWRVLILWECSLKGGKSEIEQVGLKIKSWLSSNDDYLEI